MHVRSLILVAMAAALGSRPSAELRLLRIGAFHGDEVRARSGERWLGLFPVVIGFELRATRILVNTIHDPIVDESDTVATGKNVTIDQSGRPVVLLPTSLHLAEGGVATAIDSLTPLEPGQPLAIRFQGVVHELLAADGWGVAGVSVRLVLTSGGLRQTLAVSDPERASDGFAQVLWAGDLDRDGRLDLVLDASDHYNMSFIVLYLSSHAQGGQLVGRVASLATRGC